MLNIGICYNKKDFEYDVYSLVRAFYPQSQVTTYYVDEEHTGEYPLLFLVTYEDDHIELEIREDGEKVLENTVEIAYEEDRKETKNALKNLIYGSLQTLTGKSLPWGNLTGIRPTKIAYGMLEQGMSEEDIVQTLADTHYVSEEKSLLSIYIAKREKFCVSNFAFCKKFLQLIKIGGYKWNFVKIQLVKF